MRAMIMFGIALFIAGLAALVWPAVTYTTTDEVLDLGPLEVTTQDRERIDLPPAFGIATAAAGVALIAIGSRRRTA